MKLRNENWVFANTSVPINGDAEHVRKIFWEELNQCFDSLIRNYKEYFLDNSNVRMSDVETK